MAPIALAPPSGCQFPGGYQILAPAADESRFLAPLGFNNQPGAIGGGEIGDVRHRGDGDRIGYR